MKRNEKPGGANRRGGRSRADMHLSNAQDEDDQVGEEKKNCANATTADWKP